MSDTSQALHRLNFIFDRPVSGHRWEDASRDDPHEIYPYNRALRSNWRIDGRVDSDRERALLNDRLFSETPSAALWLKQIQDYYQQRLCQPAEQSCYRQTYNQVNEIKTISPHDQLTHVESMTLMIYRLSTAEHRNDDFLESFHDITGSAFPHRTKFNSRGLSRSETGGQVDKIVADLEDRSPDNVRALAGLLCDALGANRPPWWAGFYQEMLPLMKNANPLPLIRSLGLGHFNAKDWLLFWRYDVSQAMPLFRPTAIDAGSNGLHFPSVPSTPWGTTMPLAEDTDRTFPEVLHAPLSGDKASRLCTGVLAQLAELPLKDDNQIINLRRKQRLRLAQECENEKDENWLNRHDSMP